MEDEIKKKLEEDIAKKSPGMRKLMSVVSAENLAKIKKGLDNISGESKKREKKNLQDKKERIEKTASIDNSIKLMKILTREKIKTHFKCENSDEIISILNKKLDVASTVLDYKRYILNYGVFLTILTSSKGFCNIEIPVLKHFINSQNLNTDYDPSSIKVPEPSRNSTISTKSTLMSEEDKLKLVNSILD